MAHLRKHKDSKFWFMRYRDETGQWRDKSLKLAIEDPKDTRDALNQVARQSAREQAIGPEDRNEEFAHWVPAFIEAHYSRESTRRRSAHAWERVREWLQARRLRHPRQIRYEHAQDYLAWRKLGGGAAHNTALLEVRFLAFLLNEAVRRRLCDSNPLLRIGVGRTPAKVKPELTDDDIAACRKVFAKLPRARAVFEIMLYTGCRFAEVGAIKPEDVDFKRKTLTITDAKRGDTDPRKRFSIPLHPALTKTLRGGLPGVLTREANHRFNRLMQRACGATSHSLRVTFVTRCHRAGLSEREAMRLVNHSTRLVHQVYSRLGADDLREAQARVSLPPAAR